MYVSCCLLSSIASNVFSFPLSFLLFTHPRSPLWGANAYMFCRCFFVFLFVFCLFFVCFFLFFSSVKNMKQPFSGTAERIFTKLLPNDSGDVVWNVVPPLGESRAAAWRMGNVDDLLWDNRSRERLNGFSWNFYQTMGGCSLKRRAAAWRMANVDDDLRNLRYFRNNQRAPRRLRYRAGELV